MIVKLLLAAVAIGGALAAAGTFADGTGPGPADIGSYSSSAVTGAIAAAAAVAIVKQAVTTILLTALLVGGGIAALAYFTELA